MFSFLGLRKDSKKSTTEREAEGGFIIVGEKYESILKANSHFGMLSKMFGPLELSIPLKHILS